MKIKLSFLSIDIEWIMIVVLIASLISKKVYAFFENFYICFLFIIFHEMAHMFVASILGITSKKLKFCMSGVCVEFNSKFYTNDTNNIKKLLVFFAGPLSNFVLAIIFKNIQMVYEINIFLGILNLVPIFPLDGYNIITVLCNSFKKKKNAVIKCLNGVLIILPYLFKILLFIIGTYQFIMYKTVTVFVIIIYVFVLEKSQKRKISSDKIMSKIVY